MYYVYRFLDKSKNIIYVGKSKQDLERRYKNHLHLPNECYGMVYKIEFIECKTESDMTIKEIYYINKYQNDTHPFFNLLDKTEVPTSVEFNDKWKMYRGPLPAHFSKSLNYKKGYVSQKELKYNKDGTINKLKSHKQQGESSFVDGLTKKEVDLIINQLIQDINISTNENQEQIRFRNLLMFSLSINLPLKTADFLTLKYKDIFDEKDNIKDFKFILGRHQKDQSLSIPIRSHIKELIYSYTLKYGLSYKKNSEDFLFISRQNNTFTTKAWGRIVSTAAECAHIRKNIGAESIRKTYGLNIYNNCQNKLNALLFLGELWGEAREVKLIKYLGLTDETIDYDYYLGETFTLGIIDIRKINCLDLSTSIKIKKIKW